MKIPFNKPYMTGNELRYISQAHENLHLSGDGIFTKRCSEWLEEQVGCHKALLTHSCTAALEIAVILAEVNPGDEVIMPSFTFASTANAVVLRGGVPVFVDIRPDTLNIDETKIEAAINNKTKAIMPVHYAGIGCEMDVIMDIAKRHNLIVIEDAAQSIGSFYKGRPLGSIGHLGCLSFHETKNISSGEGGALLINAPELVQRAEIIREKGTNRSQFFRGMVAKYTWLDIGSSYLPSDLVAAFLWAQLEQAEPITNRRLVMWKNYHESLFALEEQGKIRRPVLLSEHRHNAHLYYLLCNDPKQRDSFLEYINSAGIGAVFHYIPLHSSSAGLRFGRSHGDLSFTDSLSARLVRLPLWLGLEEQQKQVIATITTYLKASKA